MDVVTLGAALSIMKKMPDTAASSAAAAEDAADRAEEAAKSLTIDDTLTKPGQPADSKAVGDVLAKKLDITTVPNIADNANQLLSEKYIVDTEPYLFRPSGGQGADRAFNTIVGGSIVWNQLVDDSDSSVTVANGHKYIAKINNAYSAAVSDGTAVAVTGGTDEVFDITQMFSSTIADYIYSLEQATAGAGVAWFRKYFPNDYYDYNSGEVMHVSDLQSHDTVGFNAWDEEWESAKIDWNTYIFVPSTNSRFTPKNYVPVISEATYYCKLNRNNTILVGYTDDSGNGGREITIDVATNKVTIPSDVKYIKFGILNYGNTYNHDICINLSGTRDGEYKPYVKHSYPLDSSLTLRGIPKLVDGKLSFDGDIYKPDGTVERRYGIVDLGTLDWSSSQLALSIFRATIPNIKSVITPPYTNRLIGAICSKYSPDTQFTISDNMSDKAWIRDSVNFYIRDTDYETVASFKAAMSGVYLVYKLAEPTTEEAQSFQSPQIVDDFGTEEYVTTSLVPVGHETKYPENLRGKIEGLPWNFANLIAPVEAEFKATRNYTSGSLFIVDNTLYKATANIANGGTITPNTNCTATTLAEIIAAL